MNKYYVAGFVPEREDDGGGYSVYFPDVPQCYTGGATLEEAMDMASDVLSMMLRTHMRDKRVVPPPSSLEQVREMVKQIRKEAELDYPENAVYQLVKAPSLASETIKITISLPKDTLEELDEKAQSLGFTRSGLLVAAAKAYPQA